MISSVSDDRSIRLWQLTFPSERGEPTAEDWRGVSSSPMATLYGHSARVWDIRLLKNCFVSIGEDATCCVWDYQWQITQKLKGHKGKSIWSLATSVDDKFVVTGGGDGSIRLWELDSESAQNGLIGSSLVIPENIKGSTDDHPRIVALLNFNTILIMTMEGILCSYFITEETWHQVFRDEDFRSYSLLAVCRSTAVVALGSITGTLKILTQRPHFERSLIILYHEKIFPGKIFGLCWLNECHLLITGPDGVMVLMKMHQSADTSVHLESLGTLFLPACKQRWVSAGLAMWSDGLLVCGDKGGTVHCYSLQPEQLTPLKPPDCSFPKIHGKCGVTDVCRHGNYVLTAGRDGHYRTWKVVEGKLQLLNSNKVMKGMEWIDGLQITEDDLLVYGFHSAYFTVWSVKKNEKVIEVECGGGHRSWDCLIDNSLARFVYLKSKDVILFEKKLTSSQRILKPAFHGRALCDVKYIATLTDSTGVPVYLMATCSEDTTINIVSVAYNNGIPELRVDHTLQGHLSSVRALCLSTSCRKESDTRDSQSSVHSVTCGDDQSYGQKIMFSGGGRAQIQVWCVHFRTGCASLDSIANSNYTDRLFKTPHFDDSSSCIDEKTSMASPAERYSSQNDVINSLLSVKSEEEFSHGDAHNKTSSLSDCGPSDMTPDRTTTHSDDPSPTLLGQSQVCGSTEGDDVEALVKVPERTFSFCDSVSPTEIQEPEIDSNVPDQTISQGTRTSLKSSTLTTLKGHGHHHGDIHTKSHDAGGCLYEHLANCFLGDQRHSRGNKPWKVMFSKADPETRILDLTAFSADDIHRGNHLGLHFVAAACSDGFVRFLGFNESSRSLSLLQQSGYHGSCVLKVHHFPVRHGQDHSTKMLLLSAATDGRVAIWDVTSLCDGYIHHVNVRHDQEEHIAGGPDNSLGPGRHSTRNKSRVTQHPDRSVQISVNPAGTHLVGEDFTPVHVLKSHQSGVNSLHVRELKNNRYMICSGGDDNCLSVCVVTVTGVDGLLVTMTTDQVCWKPSAHAAQITGTWIVSDDHIVTVSIDQRVCVWRVITETGKSLQVKLIDTKYIHVSDVSNIDIWQDRGKIKVAICGEGLSILTIDSVKSDTSAS
ncbi:WD repeat-containing protein 6-like isoform X2 [Gigantopelta aegis]|nr:WD repeat-containing protein 6-like isoform X2 [Gigantopelta aegis]